MVAINEKGESVLYPPVEMLFDQKLNLLDYQLCPAEIDKNTLWKIEAIALSVVRNFKSPGIFAVEMFINRNNDVLVNVSWTDLFGIGCQSIVKIRLRAQRRKRAKEGTR